MKMRDYLQTYNAAKDRSLAMPQSVKLKLFGRRN